MMPHRFNLSLNRIFHGIASRTHFLDELMHPFYRQSPRFDSSSLSTNDTMMPACVIYSHDSILGRVFSIAITKVEQFPVKKAITERSSVINHCLDQLILACKLLEGKYPIWMVHLIHLCFIFRPDADMFGSRPLSWR
jgi:hypothetical protein